jgi:triacylglycerol lipase
MPMRSRAKAKVVLLHALGRTRLSLLFAERYLRRAGLDPVSIPYPSRREPIERLAELVRASLPQEGDRPLHFVTHSLGGIVLRYLVQAGRPPNLGRVVMLGPPNRGSQLATRLKRSWLFRLATGPAGQQIGSDAQSVPNRLGPADFELGVIAGTTAFDPFRFLISGQSDGKVTLDETRVDGQTDWLAVRRAHALLVNDPRVLSQAVHFIAHGRFAR